MQTVRESDHYALESNRGTDNEMYKLTTCHRKMKKGKSQIAINQANRPSEFFCSIRTCTSYLPVGICYCFEGEKRLKKKFQQGNATAANESTLRIMLNQLN